MRKILATAILVLAVIGGAFSRRATSQGATAAVARKPVLVELFTSEGCSSCPSADVLLQKLEAQQPVKGAQVIALEEHVDYWNHDGWIDPYSSAEWTERQQTYATLMGKDPYTPELVVDGGIQLVGNSPKEAVLAIEDARASAKTEIEIAQTGGDAKEAHFKISAGQVQGKTDGDSAEVWLAVTEDGLHSSVNRGENAGHELTHVATLRWLHRIGVANTKGEPVSFGGESTVKFNSRWNAENLRAIVFVQMKKSRQVVGAASIKIAG
jgi:hypothetical protein